MIISEAPDKYLLGFVYLSVRKRLTNRYTKPNKYFSGALDIIRGIKETMENSIHPNFPTILFSIYPVH